MYGRMLGIDGLFLAKLSETVINQSKDGYSELEEKKDYIFKILTEEEKSFNKTIDQGLAILSDMMADMEKNGTLASPATALASMVLPVPGGPTSRMPFGMEAPMSLYLPGLWR